MFFCFFEQQVIVCQGPKRTPPKKKKKTEKHNEIDACDFWVTFQVIWLLIDRKDWFIHGQSSKSAEALKS